MSFIRDGFEIVRNVLDEAGLTVLRQATARACEHFRAGCEAHLKAGVSLGSYAAGRPERNPGVASALLETEPYILGNLAGLHPDFVRVLSQRPLWQAAARLLGVEEAAIVYHSSQVIRKPAHVGPALSWHRDYANTYISTAGPHFLRLLVPLEAMQFENGGTGVIPGSHLISDEEAFRREGFEESGDGAVYPRVRAGDALVMHSKIIHGGNPNRSERDRQLMAVQFGLQTATMLHVAPYTEHLTMRRREAMISSHV